MFVLIPFEKKFSGAQNNACYAHDAQYITLTRFCWNRDVTALPPLQESRPEIPKVRKEGRGYTSFNDLLDPMTIFFLEEVDPLHHEELYFLRDLRSTAREERGNNSGMIDLHQIEYLMVNSWKRFHKYLLSWQAWNTSKVTEGNKRSFKLINRCFSRGSEWTLHKTRSRWVRRLRKR